MREKGAFHVSPRRCVCAVLLSLGMIATPVLWAQEGRVISEAALDAAEKRLRAKRKALRKDKGSSLERYTKMMQLVEAARAEVAPFEGGIPATPKAAGTYASLLNSAGMFRESIPHHLAWLASIKEKLPGMDAASKLGDFPTWKPGSGNQKDFAKKLKKHSEKLSEFARSMQAWTALSVGFAYSEDLKTLSSFLQEARRVLRRGSSTRFHPSPITALSLLGFHGVSKGELQKLGNDYASFLTSKHAGAWRRSFSCLGKQAPRLAPRARIGPPEPAGQEELERSVLLLHFFEAAANDQQFGRITRLAKAYRGKGLQTLGITAYTGGFQDVSGNVDTWTRPGDEPLSQFKELHLLRELHAKLALSWPVWLVGRWKAGKDGRRDPAHMPQIHKRCGVTHLPTVVLVGRGGRVRHLHELDARDADLEACIEALLAEKAPEPGDK